MLQIEADLTAPAAAHVSAKLTRPEDAWQIDGKVTSTTFALEPWLPSSRTTLQAVALDFSARPRSIVHPC